MTSHTLNMRSENGHWRDVVDFFAREDGSLGISISTENIARGRVSAADAEFPASDARRLRDWLNERYPEDTTNG